ncbi:MAG: glycoside hydrolase family 127 protein [Candidatus Brocadiia bacterium]
MTPEDTHARPVWEPVPFENVQFTDRFWAPRMETNRSVTLPAQYEHLKDTGRIDAWRLDWQPGDPNPPHKFWDSDVAKWLEAVGWTLAAGPDPELERLADRVIELIAGAQQPDGYLNTHFTVAEPDKRWTNLRDDHELYCAGHLIEAAVAYHRATGKERFLKVLRRYAEHIDRVFGREEGQLPGYPGHEEIELALVKLYRATREERFLGLASYFINERGREPHYFDREAERRREEPPQRDPASDEAPYSYWQAHLPVHQQSTAEGHAVRAMYLYSGMADVALETGDVELADACRRLWDNATRRRMYVTGGIGSGRRGERFTFDYDLPNETAYAETCAAIGLVFFAHRMLRFEADGRYADAMERTLYNGVLSGISLDGRRYFYENPLTVHPGATRFHGLNHGSGEVTRRPWFGCACCPPNIARLLASLPQYAYGQSADTAFVHLYVQGTAELSLGGNPVGLDVETDYPWDGDVQISVSPEGPGEFTLALRVPGWCRAPRAAVNGTPVPLEAALQSGYARIRRWWRPGDTVELQLPMRVERIEASPRVRADCGRVALQRGPLVYCLEEVDNGPDLRDIVLPRDSALEAHPAADLPEGVLALNGPALRRDPSEWDGELYRATPSSLREVRIKAVPYFAWCNREPGEMLVWIQDGRSMAISG